MLTTDVAIIGGGQSGLATSRSLSSLGIDHVVLERGRAGERWHSQRWESLNLLTTTGMSALPGLPHEGRDPESFMSATDFASHLDRYAEKMAVPLVCGAAVGELTAVGGHFRIRTPLGDWRARAVVVATGACDLAYRPPVAAAMDPRLVQIHAAHYRRPSDLPPGGVLVVGASASGVQLAEELSVAGHPVTLSVGEHLGVPRRYRGKDFYVWLGELGVLDERIADPAHRAAMLRQPSLQLIGSAEKRDISLATLLARGVNLTGRLCGVTDRRVEFDDSLAACAASAHARKLKLLDKVDLAIDRLQPGAVAAEPGARASLHVEGEAGVIDLYDRGIRSILWATGYVRRYPWLHLPVTDGRGELLHNQGMLPVPGLFAMGLNFLRRRQSALIAGCGRDAHELAPLIKAHLDAGASRAA